MCYSKSNDAQYLYFVKNKRFPLDSKKKEGELSSLKKKKNGEQKEKNHTSDRLATPQSNSHD